MNYYEFCNLARKEICQIKEVRYNFSNALLKGTKLPEKSRDLLKVLDHLERRGVIKTEMALASIDMDFSDVKIKIIYPEWKDLAQSFFSQTGRNEGCIVLTLDYNNKKVLFGADLIAKDGKRLSKEGKTYQ